MDKSQYVAGALKDVTFNGKVYAFPHYNGANVIAYNAELFKKAGLDPNKPPKSFDQELQYAKTIKAKTGVAGFAPTLGPTKIEALLMQNGLDVVKDGKPAFNSPAHVAFVKKLTDAYKAGALLKDNLFSQDNFQVAMAAYNGGRLAMLESTPTTLTRVRDEAPKLYVHTRVAPAPLGPTGIAAGGWMFNFAVARNVDKAFLVNFITVSKLQLTDSYSGVVLPTLAGAVGIFLMKQAFEAVPQDLIDAARVDGASEWQIFWRIMLPLARPALAALTILTTVSAWNQYIWPSIVMSSPDKFPLSVGVLYLAGAFSFKTRVVAAGAVLTVLPILIVFLFTQRYFLRGFDGAVK
ncbi:extracellular solute-binding protein (plasmid) [Chromobacterium amazonense]|nr:extracellular solute-binding protein [Chromobacterium amazonense]MDE1713835.1 extracellular solute-binding protein [Chromobacterium amazonense]